MGEAKRTTKYGGALPQKMEERPESWDPVRLYLERTAAAAGGLHLGIIELEAGTFQSLDEIHFRTVQVKQTGLVHKDLEIAELVGFVQHIGLILEGHRVAEARTSAAHYCNTQSSRGRLLRRHNLLDLADRFFGYLHHAFKLLEFKLCPVPLYK